jgi:hypothetical protein
VRAVLLPPTAAGEEAAASGGLVDEATLPLLHGAMVRGAERREKQAARAQVGGFPVYGAVWGGALVRRAQAAARTAPRSQRFKPSQARTAGRT